MRKFVTVNLNDQVYVTLTPEGKEIFGLHAHCLAHKVVDVLPNALDIILKEHTEGDKHYFHLYELCHIFGPHLYTGCKIPFENNKLEIVES
jgi:hypothetical protein